MAKVWKFDDLQSGHHSKRGKAVMNKSVISLTIRRNNFLILELLLPLPGRQKIKFLNTII